MPALFVSYSGVLGGAERILLDMAGGLAETPTLACPEGPLAERARADGVHVIGLPERPLDLRRSGRDRVAAAGRIAAHARELRALARDLRPDVLVAWGMRAQLAATALGRDRPRLLFQHNDLLPGPAIGRAVRAAARRADVVCALSACIARDLDPRGELDVRVVHPGVDLERFRVSPRPAGAPEVLVLGAIVPWKRPELALEAVAQLPQVRLRLAGEPFGPHGGRLLDELRHRAAQPELSGRVEFAGAVDAAEALARATCLLHCADREPFGLALAEGLAAGRPVVAAASCGPAEIVDESCGRLYRPGHAGSAAAALDEVLRNADCLGQAARARAEQLFDVEDARRRYAKLVGVGRQASGGRISFVTVTHNSEQHVARLLASVEAHLPESEVIVVDSGSSDGTAELARRRGARVIELGENVGFGRGSNAGVAEASRPVTVLVNPDVELLDSSLATMTDDIPAERILAPLVLLPDGSRQDSAQAEPGSPATGAIALVPPVLMPRPLRRAVCPWTDERQRRVGWAVGCCLVARTETLRSLGPFDERTFMYGEDLDLGLRAADAGIETWFRPDARVLHHRAHASREAFGGEPVELLAARRRAVVAERRGRRTALLDDALQLVTFVDRIAIKWLARRDTRREREQLRALLQIRRS